MSLIIVAPTQAEPGVPFQVKATLMDGGAPVFPAKITWLMNNNYAGENWTNSNGNAYRSFSLLSSTYIGATFAGDSIHPAVEAEAVLVTVTSVIPDKVGSYTVFNVTSGSSATVVQGELKRLALAVGDAFTLYLAGWTPSASVEFQSMSGGVWSTILTASTDDAGNYVSEEYLAQSISGLQNTRVRMGTQYSGTIVFEPVAPPPPPPPPVYTCPIDGLTFSTQAELDAHMASAHPDTPPPPPPPPPDDSFLDRYIGFKGHQPIERILIGGLVVGGMVGLLHKFLPKKRVRE